MRCHGFGERLYNIRESKAMTTRALAEHAGISHTQISRLEMGHNMPSIEAVERLADALGESACTLAFGAGERPAEEGTTFGTRLLEARQKRGLSHRALGELSGLAHSRISFYEIHDEPNPTIKAVRALAKALSVSPEWLAFGVGKAV